MSPKAKLLCFIYLVVIISSVWLTAQAQSGRRKQQSRPAPPPLPEITSTPAAAVALTPTPEPTPVTRGSGMPVLIAFAPDRTSPSAPLPGVTEEWRVVSSQPLASRLAEWLYLKGGMAVTGLTSPSTAQQVKELAKSRQEGFIIWVQLSEQRVYRPNRRCYDPCSGDCLRQFSNYKVHYTVFVAQEENPVKENHLEVEFDKYRYFDRECEKRNGIYSKSSGGSKRLFGRPVCFNASPNELTLETLECVGRKVSDQLDKSRK